ncbi:ABC transporter permease [Pseudonocardia asaccharolytica]|uniref:ABC transporter permease n=1 Tax=Pseudonocardia asaccharolytica TaxID=54010 RepID=UPI0021BF11F8|nr:ABC transporter permease [Pseudonocardia asaccharolytica]
MSAKRRFLRRFLRSRVAVVALLVLLLGAAAAVFAPALAPVDPLAQDLGKVLRPPGGENLLGTDELGRDVLSRLLFGARVSLLAAVEGTAIALLLGVLPGLAAGYLGRRVDRIIMLFTDALMSYPAIILAIAIIGAIGPGLTNAMLAVGIITAPRVVRLVRGVVLGIREETYIEASRTIGTPTARIIVRHVLPNALAPVIVFGSIMAGQAMLIEAGLSFLGLGVQPPDASWGSMLGTAFRYVSRSPTLIVFPGLAIAVTVLAFNVLGDGLRDSLGRENRGER